MRLIIVLLSLIPSLLFSQGSGGISAVSIGSNDCDCETLAPVIDSIPPLASASENETLDVIFTGAYFEATTTLSSSCFSVNSTTYISHDSILVNITTATGQQICDVEATNSCGTSNNEAVFKIENFACNLAKFTAYGQAYDTSVQGEVIRTHTAGWGNHGFFSNSNFIENVGDYVEFQITTIQFVIGLSYNSAPNAGWDEEDFSFYSNATTSTYTRSENAWIAGNNWGLNRKMRLEINTSNQIEFKIETSVGSNVFTIVRTSNLAVTGQLFPFGSSGNGASATVTNYNICK